MPEVRGRGCEIEADTVTFINTVVTQTVTHTLTQISLNQEC